MSWKNESQRHQLASKGIETARNIETNIDKSITIDRIWEELLDYLRPKRINLLPLELREWSDTLSYEPRIGNYLYQPIDEEFVFIKIGGPFTDREMIRIDEALEWMKDVRD